MVASRMPAFAGNWARNSWPPTMNSVDPHLPAHARGGVDGGDAQRVAQGRQQRHGEPLAEQDRRARHGPHEQVLERAVLDVPVHRLDGEVERRPGQQHGGDQPPAEDAVDLAARSVVVRVQGDRESDRGDAEQRQAQEPEQPILQLQPHRLARDFEDCRERAHGSHPTM
jgi:hypothetical protein